MKLIIEQPWGGLGDNLQFSTIPEVGKSLGYDVYVSNYNKYRNDDIKKLVWDTNPYLCGYINEKGNVLRNKYPNDGCNVIGMHEKALFGNIYNELPKLYYEPNIIKDYLENIIIDPNAISTKLNFENIIKEYPDSLLINASSPDNLENKKNIVTKDIFNWVDIIYSCKQFICQYSGGAIAMAAYNKSCLVYKGVKASNITFKFKMHTYIEIKQ